MIKKKADSKAAMNNSNNNNNNNKDKENNSSKLPLLNNNSKKRKAAPAKKTKRKKKDPNAPTRPLTSYMFFVKHNRADYHAKFPQLLFGDLSRKMASAWKALSEEEKKTYTDMHTQDKIRFEKEMKNYKKPESSSSSSGSSSSSSGSSSSSSSSSDDSSEESSEASGKNKKKKQSSKKKKSSKKNKKGKPPKKKAKTDPNAPKKATNAYVYFTKDNREKFKKEKADMKPADVTKELALKWKNLTDAERAPYLKSATEDKVRYEKELKEYEKGRK